MISQQLVMPPSAQPPGPDEVVSPFSAECPTVLAEERACRPTLVRRIQRGSDCEKVCTGHLLCIR